MPKRSAKDTNYSTVVKITRLKQFNTNRLIWFWFLWFHLKYAEPQITRGGHRVKQSTLNTDCTELRLTISIEQMQFMIGIHLMIMNFNSYHFVKCKRIFRIVEKIDCECRHHVGIIMRCIIYRANRTNFPFFTCHVPSAKHRGGLLLINSWIMWSLIGECCFYRLNWNSLSMSGGLWVEIYDRNVTFFFFLLLVPLIEFSWTSSSINMRCIA